MAVLEYPYQPYFRYQGSRYAPIARCLAVNLLNGLSVEFLGVMDTGADITGLTKDIFRKLEIDVDSLPEDDFDGSAGLFPGRFCDFIKIAFIDPVNFRNHWPNNSDPVPIGLVYGERNLLGRDLFLDKCTLTFDGQKRTAFVDLGVKDIQLAGRHRGR